MAAAGAPPHDKYATVVNVDNPERMIFLLYSAMTSWTMLATTVIPQLGLSVFCGPDDQLCLIHFIFLISATRSPEIGAINRHHFLAPVFPSYHIRLEWKFPVPKINVAESDVDDEFVKVAAVIIACTVAKGKLKRYISNRNKSYMIISVTCTPVSGLEKSVF